MNSSFQWYDENRDTTIQQNYDHAREVCITAAIEKELPDLLNLLTEEEYDNDCCTLEHIEMCINVDNPLLLTICLGHIIALDTNHAWADKIFTLWINNIKENKTRIIEECLNNKDFFENTMRIILFDRWSINEDCYMEDLKTIKKNIGHELSKKTVVLALDN